MSLDTWKAEFYPIPADQVPVEDALDHSIKKWSGLTKENMEKHGVRFVESYCCLTTDSDVAFNPVLGIDAGTCALCLHHLKTKCKTCPIVLHTGDQEARCNKQYRAFAHEFAQDPIPMVNLLNSVKEAQQ